jgi:neutral ceramidase
MMRVRRANAKRVIAVGVVAVVTGCTSLNVPSVGTLSPLPAPSTAEFVRAGFAKVDITPPVGIGLALAGTGPESGRATGYRLRLYAKVLVLEDTAGNRLALVVADLPLGSALLQRRVAERTSVTDSIGIDRLALSVTHTHAGVGHYFDAQAYNELGSSVAGYDPQLVDSLVNRIAGAIDSATRRLRRARVAWGSRAVWGLTRIRSMPAILRNVPLPAPFAPPPPGMTIESGLVNPYLTMLRVDFWDAKAQGYRPAGAYSVFAMHGTGNSPVNDLFDADIQGIAERGLERHIDAANHDSAFRLVPQATYLFANGTEGDVSPAWPTQTRCLPPTLRTLPGFSGPPMLEEWRWVGPSPVQRSRCLDVARRSVTSIGDSLAHEAIRLFDALADSVRITFPLRRAFVTVALKRDWDSLGVCRHPAAGMSALAGADDGVTRLNGWHLFGLFDLGLEQGPNSPSPVPSGCHETKRLLFGTAGSRALSAEFSTFAEVSVFQLGDVLVANLPAEITTTAGLRMRDAMLAAARMRDTAVKRALVVSNTNGYLEYVTTADEYGAQYYEGGATLYGPGEAAMFTRTVATLTRQLNANDILPSAATWIDTFRVGKARSGSAPRKPPPHAPVVAGVSGEPPRCASDTLYVKLRFGLPGDWMVSDGGLPAEPKVRIVHPGAGDATWPLAWDDQPDVEMHLLDEGKHGVEWELRWSHVPPGEYEVRVGTTASVPVMCPALRAGNGKPAE